MTCHLLVRHLISRHVLTQICRPCLLRLPARARRPSVAAGGRSSPAAVRRDGSHLDAAGPHRPRARSAGAEGPGGVDVARRFVGRAPARQSRGGRPDQAQGRRERSPGEDHSADATGPRHRRQGRDGGAPDQGRCAGRPVRQGRRDDRPGPRACLPRAPPLRRGRPLTAPLWLLTLITFSGTLAMHIFVPALPEAARDLGASVGGMQMTVSVYILGLAVGQLAYGPLSDRFRRPPVLMAGLVLYALARPAPLFAA